MIIPQLDGFYTLLYFTDLIRLIFVKAPKRFIFQCWWKYMPGVKVKITWPTGDIVVDHNDPRWKDMGGAVWVNLGFSADPNDHYRPWLEKNVGKQGWHWNWTMEDNDAAENSLTLKVCKNKSKYATLAALKWSK